MDVFQSIDYQLNIAKMKLTLLTFKLSQSVPLVFLNI